MKIGIITEDSTALKGLKTIFKNLQPNLGKNTVNNVIHVNIHPDTASTDVIASKCKQAVNYYRSEKVTKIIFIIDREQKSDCPPKIAKKLEESFHKQGYTEVSVVVKNKTLENWICSDVNVFTFMPKKFNISQSFIKSITPNKADNIDADQALKSICAKGVSYHKSTDFPRLAEKFCHNTAANNSRSFRRLLRELGHSKYLGQSKKP